MSLKKKRISNAFNWAGISFKAVNGLLGLDKTPAFAKADEVTAERPEAIRVWKEIEEWCRAAAVKRNLTWARFGFLGGYYSGMGVYHGKRVSADPSPGSVCGSQCRPVFQDCRAYEYSLCDLLMKKRIVKEKKNRYNLNIRRVTRDKNEMFKEGFTMIKGFKMKLYEGRGRVREASQSALAGDEGHDP